MKYSDFLPGEGGHRQVTWDLLKYSQTEQNFWTFRASVHHLNNKAEGPAEYQMPSLASSAFRLDIMLFNEQLRPHLCGETAIT